MHDEAVLDNVRYIYGEHIGVWASLVSKALLDNSSKSFVNIYHVVNSRNLIGSHLGSGSAEGIYVWTGEPSMPVIRMTHELH